MGKEILTLGDIEIEKNKFYRHKNPASLRDVDIEKDFVTRFLNKIFLVKKIIWLLG